MIVGYRISYSFLGSTSFVDGLFPGPAVHLELDAVSSRSS